MTIERQSFTLNLEPVAAPRPKVRAFKAGGKLRGQAYYPTKYKNWVKVGQVILSGLDLVVMEGPLAVSAFFVFPCLKTEERKTAPAPMRWKPQKPDVDNIAKAVLDLLGGHVWKDDSQVVDLHVRKLNAPQGVEPFIRVTIATAEEIPESWVLKTEPSKDCTQLSIV